jgi:hypothetical protein
MWGPPQRGNYKEAGGNGAKELRNGMGEMGVRRIRGRGAERLWDMMSMGRSLHGEFVHWKRN